MRTLGVNKHIALTAVSRGARKRCPHCGEGELFLRGLQVREFCGSCNFKLELKAGNTWAFWVFFDRLLIGVPILIFLVALPLGFGLSFTSVEFYVFAVVIFLLILCTSKQRYGVCVALEYLARRLANEPEDDFPELGTESDQ